MKRKQMMISFGAYDDDVYDFLQGNKNASALIRMLVREYMRGNKIPTYTPPAPVQEQPVAKAEKVEKQKEEPETNNGFDYSKCNTDDTTKKNTSNETNKNRKKIQNLDL